MTWARWKGDDSVVPVEDGLGATIYPNGIGPGGVSGCIVWLDAEDGVEETGGVVDAWRDLSGYGNDFIYDTTYMVAGNKPDYTSKGIKGAALYGGAPHGSPNIENGKFLVGPSLSYFIDNPSPINGSNHRGWYPWNIFIIQHTDEFGTDNNPIMFCCKSTSSYGWVILGGLSLQGGQNYTKGQMYGPGNQNVQVSYPNTITGVQVGYNIIEYTYSQALKRMTSEVNDSGDVNTSTNTNYYLSGTNNWTTLGAYAYVGNQPASYWTRAIKELAIFIGPINASGRTAIINYFKSKYSIA